VGVFGYSSSLGVDTAPWRRTASSMKGLGPLVGVQPAPDLSLGYNQALKGAVTRIGQDLSVLGGKELVNLELHFLHSVQIASKVAE
jgi:hypothetical protein